MKMYIAKPLKVEAIKVTKENAEEVKAWANSIQPADSQIWSIGAGLQIPTQEGVMTCGWGDYLVKEPFPTNDRMFYPVKAEIFERRYDEAGTDEITSGSRVRLIRGKNKGDEGMVQWTNDDNGKARIKWDNRRGSTVEICNICKI